MINILLTTSS